MAPKPVLLSLLWGLSLFLHGVTSLFNVTCSTDYELSLNCSCSGSLPTSSVLLKVMCRDEELEVHGSCDVKPPQSWCVMYPEKLDDVTSIGTMCVATASQQGDRVLTKASESSSWALSDVVKPLPPVNVEVTNTNGFYNITWDHDNQKNCLTYRVRIRDSKDLSKDPAHTLLVKEKYSVLDHEVLQPHVIYTVDVQAKMCPGNVILGPWSEWSSTAEFIDSEGVNGLWWYVTLPAILVLGLLLLGYLKKTWWQKKIQRIIYIPRADEFFKPLDLNYGGNFKEWVKPVFRECDYLRINAHTQTISEKQRDIFLWNKEKQVYRENSQMTQGALFLHVLQPHRNSLLCFQDGNSSQGAGHSTGHISIHTVTLSGEEFDEEVASHGSVNTLRSYRDGESFGSFEEHNRHAGYDLQEQMLPLHENQISNDSEVETENFQPRAQINEPERVSLNSFESNEQSEDGYPHVDLDTIDSGFGECSSPGVSHSNISEQMDSNSNYVKQWMICSTIQEDFSNSENELHETQ